MRQEGARKVRDEYLLSALKKYLLKLGIDPSHITNPNDLVLLAMVEMIKHSEEEEKMLWQEITILRNRVTRVEGK